MSLELWNKLKTPPKEAIKQIKGGRLKGMSDISPQWRYEILTEVLGPCGVGWKFTIEKQWCEAGADGEIFVFTNILFYHAIATAENFTIIDWSEPIPGTGGSKLIQREWDKDKGEYRLYNNDEAFKMSLTDALSVACKMIGVGADIYAGKTDGSKYKDQENTEQPKPECPECNNSKAVYADKNIENSFYCWKKKGGCGHKWTIPVMAEDVPLFQYDDFVTEVDKLEDADSIIDWREKNWHRVTKELKPEQQKKLAQYINQIIDTFNQS